MPDMEKVIKALNMHFRKTCKNGDCPYATVGDCEGKLLFDALALLKEQDTVVRCKDCKKRYKRSCGYFYADGRIMCDDWFCADGERKEGR